jgi:hypothetical protein
MPLFDLRLLLVIFGGVKFETYTSTLYKQPNSPLANKEFLAKHYRPETRDYFFDRDPDAFKVNVTEILPLSLSILAPGRSACNGLGFSTFAFFFILRL